MSGQNENALFPFSKIITVFSIGLALHYNEIQKSWQSCGSDPLCKTEKLVMYMTAIVGISSPSLVISQWAKNLAHEVSTRILGQPFFDQNSYFLQTLINVGTYSIVEYRLSFWWDWVKGATECLKLENCENDDILVWIHNMKSEYCYNTDLTAVMDADRVTPVCTGVECGGVGVMSNLTRISQEGSEWCTTFFNELPLFASATFIWGIYLSSLGLVKNGAIADGVQQDGKGNTSEQEKASGDEDKKDSTQGTSDDEDKKDSTQGTGDDKDKKDSTQGTDDDKGKKDSTQGTSDDKDKKDSTQETSKDAKSIVKTQKVLVTCPFCKKSRSACIPKPLSIYCSDCGNNIGLSSNNAPTTQQNPTNSQSKSTTVMTGNSNLSRNLLSGISLMVPSQSSDFKVSSVLNEEVTCLQEEKECTFTSDLLDLCDSEDDISDAEELYKIYRKLAIECKDELSSSLNAWCDDCGCVHADHVHENEQRNNHATDSIKEKNDELYGTVLLWELNVIRPFALLYFFVSVYILRKSTHIILF